MLELPLLLIISVFSAQADGHCFSTGNWAFLMPGSPAGGSSCEPPGAGLKGFVRLFSVPQGSLLCGLIPQEVFLLWGRSYLPREEVGGGG